MLGKELLQLLVTTFLNLLPTDVILVGLTSLTFDSDFNKIIGFVNFFLPVHWCAIVLLGWSAAILLLWIISYILKNINKIDFGSFLSSDK